MVAPVGAGTALLYPFHGDLHLHIVLNDPVGKRGELILAPVTTIYGGRRYDATCVLDVGDHPFIRHPSYVAYRMCCQDRVSALERRLGTLELHRKDDVSQEVFDRVFGGVYDSPQTRPFVRDFLNKA